MATATALSALTFCSGCFAVRSEAPPPPPHVRLLSESAPVQVSRKYQKWYGAWGLFPLSPADEPKYIIENEKLVEARILQQDSFEDLVAGFIYTVIFAGVILPQSIIVEGNRAPAPAASGAPETLRPPQ
ncbi:hypothetical protein KF840_09965 [bacterium]|nr:hypothetical protein [bacterium]